MRLKDLSPTQAIDRIKKDGLQIQTGIFLNRIQITSPHIIDSFMQLYQNYPLIEDPKIVDFHVSLKRSSGLRRWLRPQAVFEIDEHQPIYPLPLHQAYPLLEWGLNWCVANRAHQYLIFHAAVAERDDGLSVIMPGSPGSGKSTLCTALVHSGWRLLSDELALYSVETGEVWPLARPISLKNESLPVIQAFSDEVHVDVATQNTLKGLVGHVRVPEQWILRMAEPSRPAWIIFPRFIEDSESNLQFVGKALGFMRLLEHAFNYNVFGVEGFKSLTNTIDHCDFFDFQYSSLHDAISVFNELPVPS